MSKELFFLISFLLIALLCPSIKSASCADTSINECENGDHNPEDDYCCLWKVPDDAKDRAGETYWLIKNNNKQGGFYQGCASINRFQYQTRTSYGSRKARENGIDKNIIIQCKSSSKQTLPSELEPCKKTTENYSSPPSRDTCSQKSVDGTEGDSMCCYWKPTGKSNKSGFLDKDECAAINDDQFCDLSYYINKKKKEYQLDSLEIICPTKDNDYCDKIYCTDPTEVGGDGAEYCNRRKLANNADKFCCMWNPDKEKTNNPDYAWLSGKTRCASISETQYTDVYNYEKQKRQDTGIPNLQIIIKEQTRRCGDITDATKCKYSLENDSEYDLCCKWSVPESTTTKSSFWLIDQKYKKNSYYEGCASMTQQQYAQKTTFITRKTAELGSSNPISMDCEEGGNNQFIETPAYNNPKTAQSHDLKSSLIGILALFYLIA